MAGESEYWERFWRRRLTRRRVLQGAALGGAGLAAAAAFGCAEEEKPAATPAATARPGASPAATPTAAATPAAVQPKKGGILVGYDDGDPASFDVYLTWAYRTMMYAAMTYPRLYKFKVYPGVPPTEYAVEPDLAKSVEQPDPQTYVFKLLPATWEEKPPTNGRKLTSADVAYNWDRFMKTHPNRELFQDVDRVETPAEDTVVFKLKLPLGPFLNHMGHHGMFFVYPQELIEAGKTKTEQISAGPFVLDGAFKVGVGATYKRNPKYYRGPDRPYVDAVEYRVIPDASTQLAALRAKQVDTGFYLGISQLEEPSLRGDHPKAVYVEHTPTRNAWLGLDLDNPLFHDERVRRAISMSLDRDKLLAVSGGKGAWVTHIGPLAKWWLDPKDKAKFGENAKYYQRDLAEAKKLLSAAGVDPQSFKGLPFQSTAPWLYPTKRSEIELAHAQLKEGGLETDLKLMEFNAFYSIAVRAAKWEGFAFAVNLVGADPNEWFSLFWEPTSPRVAVKPGLLKQDTELPRLLEKQRRELKEEERVKIVYDIQRYMAGKMYNVPAVSPTVIHVHHDYVKDMHWIHSYAQATEYLEKAWLDKA